MDRFGVYVIYRFSGCQGLHVAPNPATSKVVIPRWGLVFQSDFVPGAWGSIFGVGLRFRVEGSGFRV